MTEDKKEIAKQIQVIYESNGYVKQSTESVDKYTIEQLQTHLKQLQKGKHPWITKRGVLNAEELHRIT